MTPEKGPKTILTLSASGQVARRIRLTTTIAAGRDASIVRLIKDGAKGSEVAREFGITRERVRQIWTRETGLPIPGIPPRQPIDRETVRVRRFWAKVHVVESGCWIWTGTIQPTGYGAAREPGRSGGYAHRAAYAMVKGPIPHGLQIDHLCRVPACVNPDHLEAVTPQENVRRGRNGILRVPRTECRKGHGPLAADGHCVDCRRVSNRLGSIRRAERRAAERLAAS